MNPRDAEMACKAGADAIIVSNHGGRVLDQMPGSMDVLEEIVAAVGKSITIMIDGGFRDGVDVLKAIALGADFVLIGLGRLQSVRLSWCTKRWFLIF